MLIGAVAVAVGGGGAIEGPRRAGWGGWIDFFGGGEGILSHSARPPLACPDKFPAYALRNLTEARGDLGLEDTAGRIDGSVPHCIIESSSIFHESHHLRRT